MKRNLFLIFAISLCHWTQAQYTGFSIGSGYVFAPTQMSPTIFNVTSANNQATSSSLLNEKFNVGAVPLEMEFFSKHVNFNCDFYLPIGGSSKGKEFKKVYDIPVFKVGVAGGAWINDFVGIFGGLHYHGTLYKVKSFQSTRFPNVGAISAPIRTASNGSANYYINSMGINERGLDFHVLFGERFLVKASLYYDFVRVGRKSMNLDDKVLKGTAITPELSIYFPFDEDKSFGVYAKFAYKYRKINGVNDFTTDNSGAIAGFFPEIKTTQTLITIGLMLPPGIFGSASATRTTIRVVN